MEFDRFTVVLLTLRAGAPKLDEKAENELQDAHMAFLSELHNAPHLPAAGPLLGDVQRELRGLSILNVAPDKALELTEQDPAVKAGRYSLQIIPWMVPAGAIFFSPVRFPRSMKEAAG
jgi:uncharacterized protein YciI